LHYERIGGNTYPYYRGFSLDYSQDNIKIKQ
jgi:hypothetical protein